MINSFIFHFSEEQLQLDNLCKIEMLRTFYIELKHQLWINTYLSVWEDLIFRHVNFYLGCVLSLRLIFLAVIANAKGVKTHVHVYIEFRI